MKKISELFRSSVLLIIGGLLLLVYLNNLGTSGATLAIAIVAVVFAAYYIVIGILDLAIGEKFSNSAKKLLSAFNVTLYAGLFFTEILCRVITSASAMGPTAWVLALVGMISSIAFAIVFIIAVCAPSKVLAKLTAIFGAIFALGLILNLLFLPGGGAAQIDNISLVEVIIDLCYAYVAFHAISTLQNNN